MALPEELRPVFERLEAIAALEQEAVAAGIFQLKNELGEVSEALARAFEAERFVDTLCTDETGERGLWGLYFRPAITYYEASGAMQTSHSLEKVTPEMIAYWSGRAAESRHPKLKARYADAAWEFSSTVADVPRNVQNARIAVDAYVAHVGGFKDVYPHISSLGRALIWRSRLVMVRAWSKSFGPRSIFTSGPSPVTSRGPSSRFSMSYFRFGRS